MPGKRLTLGYDRYTTSGADNGLALFASIFLPLLSIIMYKEMQRGGHTPSRWCMLGCARLAVLPAHLAIRA